MTLDPPAAPVRELVLRFAPPAHRHALGALLEIEREVLAAARDGLDHTVAHVRLAWWEEELQGLAHATARHPAARQLCEDATRGGRTPPDLRGLLEVARIDLARVAFLERSELDHYLACWADSIFRPLTLSGLAATDARTAAAERYASVAGPAIREIGLLADITGHARAGRVFVPLGDPPRPHDPWCREPLGAAESDELRERLAALHAQLQAAAAELPADTREALGAALIWTALAARDAATLHGRLPHMLRPTRCGPLRRTIAAWRAAVAAAHARLPQPLRPHATR
jgi:phytoene synthase